MYISACVTSPHGLPITNLTKENFNVFEIFGLLVGIEVVELGNIIFDGSEGYYAIAVKPNADSMWSDCYYTFGVVVTDPETNLVGRTLVKLKISPGPPAAGGF